MTLNELAEYLQIGRWTLYRLVAKGQSPDFYKVGAAYRFKKSDVAKWMTHHTIKGRKRKRDH